MTIEELSNEELTFIYVLVKEGLDVYTGYLKEQGVSFVVDSPIGKVKIFKEFSEEEMEDIANSEKYQLMMSITAKLTPIVELISDANPELLERIETALHIEPTDEEEEDEDQEEDL